MILLNLFLISVICCCIIDISGFIEEIEEYLTKILRMKTKARIPKPFSCSLCMSHLCGLILIIALGKFSLLNYGLVLLISILTPVTTEIILFIRGLLMKTVVSLGRWLRI